MAATGATEAMPFMEMAVTEVMEGIATLDMVVTEAMGVTANAVGVEMEVMVEMGR